MVTVKPSIFPIHVGSFHAPPVACVFAEGITDALTFALSAFETQRSPVAGDEEKGIPTRPRIRTLFQRPAEFTWSINRHSSPLLCCLFASQNRLYPLPRHPTWPRRTLFPSAIRRQADAHDRSRLLLGTPGALAPLTEDFGERNICHSRVYFYRFALATTAARALCHVLHPSIGFPGTHESQSSSAINCGSSGVNAS